MQLPGHGRSVGEGALNESLSVPLDTMCAGRRRIRFVPAVRRPGFDDVVGTSKPISIGLARWMLIVPAMSPRTERERREAPPRVDGASATQRGTTTAEPNEVEAALILSTDGVDTDGIDSPMLDVLRRALFPGTAADRASERTSAELASDFRKLMAELAQDDRRGLEETIDLAYGEALSAKEKRELLALAADEEFPTPQNVVFASASDLGDGVQGAYSPANGGTVYLLNSLPPDRAFAVYAEEVGHHVDAVYGPGAEADGDEGALFVRGLANDPSLNDPRVVGALKQENDRVHISGVNGIENVEASKIEAVGRVMMKGVDMLYDDPATGKPALVFVEDWRGHTDNARIRTQAGAFIEVDKLLLRPHSMPVADIPIYEFDDLIKTRKKGLQTTIARHDLPPGDQAKMIDNHRRELNNLLVQGAMANQFDLTIDSAVKRYNADNGLVGEAALDAALVKAVFYRESMLGTNGPFLDIAPDFRHYRNQFNIGQVVDSAIYAHALKYEADNPAFLAKFGDWRVKLEDQRTEFERLKAIPSRTPTEEAQFRNLSKKDSKGNDVFNPEAGLFLIKSDTSPPQLFGQFMWADWGSVTPPKSQQYDYWIEMSIFWLDHKKTPGRDWLDAVQAYNGGGARARDYRSDVKKIYTQSLKDRSGYTPPRDFDDL